jgi:hypothetical protein
MISSPTAKFDFGGISPLALVEAQVYKKSIWGISREEAYGQMEGNFNEFL